MSFTGRSCARRALVMAVGFLVALAARPALSDVDVRFERLDGFAAPGTPAKLNKVGVLEIGREARRNILVLNPGTSASAAYFAPLAKTIVEQATGWQVWAVERRENLLEDHSVLDRAKDGTATPQELFDYYLGWLADPQHHERTSSSSRTPTSAFARDWGMHVEIEDLRRVVQAGAEARRSGSSSAATRSAARSPPPTRPGTSTASPAPGASPVSCSSTAAAARPRSRRIRRRVARRRCRPARRG